MAPGLEQTWKELDQLSPTVNLWRVRQPLSAKETMSLSSRGSSRSRLPSHRLAGASGKVSICIPEVSHRLPRLHIKSPVASATPLEVKEREEERKQR